MKNVQIYTYNSEDEGELEEVSGLTRERPAELMRMAKNNQSSIDDSDPDMH